MAASFQTRTLPAAAAAAAPVAASSAFPLQGSKPPKHWKPGRVLRRSGRQSCASAFRSHSRSASSSTMSDILSDSPQTMYPSQRSGGKSAESTSKRKAPPTRATNATRASAPRALASTGPCSATSSPLLRPTSSSFGAFCAHLSRRPSQLSTPNPLWPLQRRRHSASRLRNARGGGFARAAAGQKASPEVARASPRSPSPWRAEGPSAGLPSAHLGAAGRIGGRNVPVWGAPAASTHISPNGFLGTRARFKVANDRSSRACPPPAPVDPKGPNLAERPKIK
eukprot:scaffold302_cov247-Pinguiococcus_pyrenoidosus.AAC.6